MNNYPKIVWLDAGHGAHDPGAVGPTGLKESETVLAICLKTAAILERHGVTVMQTRDRDVFVSLPDRAYRANKAKAKLFVSVHLNSAKKPVSGIETFAMIGSVKGNVLASNIQDEMLDAFPLSNDRGVKEKSYHVLRKTKMPAALVECEFMHTPEGEASFRKEETLDKCALAIAHGILKTLEIAIKKPVGSPSAKNPKQSKISEISVGNSFGKTKEIAAIAIIRALEKKNEKLELQVRKLSVERDKLKNLSATKSQKLQKIIALAKA